VRPDVVVELGVGLAERSGGRDVVVRDAEEEGGADGEAGGGEGVAKEGERGGLDEGSEGGEGAVCGGGGSEEGDTLVGAVD